MSVAVEKRSNPRSAELPPPAFRPHAGHAAHFLRRLDRVDDAQVELALGLYNKPELVRAILLMAKLPDGAERVAISLDDPHEGPFLVVTREGRFVTCLGAGMRPHHPVITRAELDRTARYVDRMRALLGQLAESRNGGARVHSLVTRLIDAGEYVSREQMEELLRWEPLLGQHFLSGALRYGESLMELSARARSIVRPKRRHERLLREYHRVLHGFGHLFVLAGASEINRRVLEEVVAEEPLVVSPTIHASAFDVAYVSRRAMWAAARWPALLPVYKQQLRKGRSGVIVADGLLGAAAIGLATPAVRDDAQHAIAKARATDPEFMERVEVYRHLLNLPFAQPELMADWAMSRARTELCERIPGLSRHEVSDADARAQLASKAGHMVWTEETMTENAIALATVVSAEPQELYLPQRIIDRIRTPWTMDKTIAALASHRATYGVRAPVRVVRTGGRNDRCPCGSGKKLKRCCLDRSK